MKKLLNKFKKSVELSAMQKNEFLLSDIFMEVEEHKYQHQDFVNIKPKGYSKDEIDYHIFLLKDAGFITVAENEEGREMPVLITWKGQLYYDSLKAGFMDWVLKLLQLK